MHRLPVELLCAIFLEAADGDSVGTLRLGQVCRWWRSIVQDQHHLWDFLELRGIPEDSRAMDIWIQNGKQVIDLNFIRHSAVHPGTMTIGSLPGQKPVFDGLGGGHHPTSFVPSNHESGVHSTLRLVRRRLCPCGYVQTAIYPYAFS